MHLSVAMSSQRKRAKLTSTENMDSSKSSISHAAEAISHLSQGLDVLQADSCALPCKSEAMQKVQEAIQMLQSFTQEHDHQMICPSNFKQFRSVEVQTRETMLKVHIHELPNECLTLVFNNIDLQKMILLMRVCSRWHGVVVAICAGKQSLAFFRGSPVPKNNRALSLPLWKNCLLFCDVFVSNSCLPKPVFHRPHCDWLVRLFPNIRQLDFPRELVDDDSSIHVIYLFQQWSSKLTSLTLSGGAGWNTECNGAVDLHKNILQAIRRLTSLRHLSLFTSKAEAPLPANILSQLDEFELGVRGTWYAVFLPCLSRLKPSCRVKLYINNREYFWGPDSEVYSKLSKYITKSKSKFAQQVTHLSFTDATRDQLLFAFQHFVNLDSLEIFSSLKLLDLVNVTIHLTKLTEIRILRQLEFEPDFWTIRNSAVQMTTLKKLTIPHSLSAEQQKAIRTIFPNLEKLSLPTPRPRATIQKRVALSSDSSDEEYH